MYSLKDFPAQSNPGELFKVVFMTLHGSRLYGMHHEFSDYDYIGCCIEPKELLIGLGNFEQHQWKGDNSEGTTYSLKKYIRLLIAGNPTLLSTAFSPVAVDHIGITSPEFHNLFVSREAGPKFYGYMVSQMKRIHTGKGLHITRAALIDKWGFDTKYASHVIRLGYQAIEYLSSGKISLPIPNKELSFVLDVRNGQYSYDEFKQMAEDLLKDVDVAYRASQLPEKPNYDAINEWLCETIISQWDYI